MNWLHGRGFSLGTLIPPTVQKHVLKLIGVSKLPVGDGSETCPGCAPYLRLHWHSASCLFNFNSNSSTELRFGTHSKLNVCCTALLHTQTYTMCCSGCTDALTSLERSIQTRSHLKWGMADWLWRPVWIRRRIFSCFPTFSGATRTAGPRGG